MKRILILMMVIGLVFGSIATAEAGKKKKKTAPPAPVKVERVVEFEYACPCPGLFQLGALTGGDPNLGGGVVSIGAGEVYLTAEATDVTGQPVAVGVQQDLDGDGGNNPVGTFCTTTAEPMAINEGLELRIFVGNPTVCPGVLAGGTIKFTLSNMP
jgi:hypothetical protein